MRKAELEAAIKKAKKKSKKPKKSRKPPLDDAKLKKTLKQLRQDCKDLGLVYDKKILEPPHCRESKRKKKPKKINCRLNKSKCETTAGCRWIVGTGCRPEEGGAPHPHPIPEPQDSEPSAEERERYNSIVRLMKLYLDEWQESQKKWDTYKETHNDLSTYAARELEKDAKWRYDRWFQYVNDSQLQGIRRAYEEKAGIEKQHAGIKKDRQMIGNVDVKEDCDKHKESFFIFDELEEHDRDLIYRGWDGTCYDLEELAGLLKANPKNVNPIDLANRQNTKIFRDVADLEDFKKLLVASAGYKAHPEDETYVNLLDYANGLIAEMKTPPYTKAVLAHPDVFKMIYAAGNICLSDDPSAQEYDDSAFAAATLALANLNEAIDALPADDREQFYNLGTWAGHTVKEITKTASANCIHGVGMDLIGVYFQTLTEVQSFLGVGGGENATETDVPGVFDGADPKIKKFLYEALAPGIVQLRNGLYICTYSHNFGHTGEPPFKEVTKDKILFESTFPRQVLIWGIENIAINPSKNGVIRIGTISYNSWQKGIRDDMRPLQFRRENGWPYQYSHRGMKRQADEIERILDATDSAWENGSVPGVPDMTFPLYQASHAISNVNYGSDYMEKRLKQLMIKKLDDAKQDVLDHKNAVDGIYAFIVKNILIYPDLIDGLLDIVGLIDESAEIDHDSEDLYWDEWFSGEFSPTRPIVKERVKSRKKPKTDKLRCKGLRKTKDPKCDDQSHCTWKKAKGLKGKYKCFKEADRHLYI
jgi:hypothetical protein